MPGLDIFLSYNREDQAVAKLFAEGFEAAGLSVWWDVTLRSGEAYDKVTEDALRSARAVVVLWSKHSVESRWVRAEATLADRNRTLVPARIEPCDLPIMFELTQTADLSHWRGEASDPAWRAFLGDVWRMAGESGKPLESAPQVPPHAAIKPTPHRKASIAVLPFINRSGQAEDDIFADCMVEDLTAALSLSKRMTVVAASATMAYRNAARDLREIGHGLNVRYLLEGNVRRVGDDLRVTAQLVEAESGDILWTRKFDRPLSEISRLQEDLAAEVAAHLGVQVERAEMEHVLRKSDDISAREAIVRADAISMGRPTPARLEAAVAEARRAVELAPGYGAAHAALAGTLSALLMHKFGYDNPEIERELLDNVAKARALDPRNPLVLCRIAAAMASAGQVEEALFISEQAVALNPNLEVVRVTYGGNLLRVWRWEEALTQCDAAERLAPDGMWAGGLLAFRSIAQYQAGRFEQALEYIERSKRTIDLYTGQIRRMLCLARLERWENAREAMRHLRGTWPEITASFVETYVRKDRMLGKDSTMAEDNAAIVRRLWEETESSA